MSGPITGDTPIIPQVDPQCWDGCVQGLANNFKCDNLTTEKVAQKAGIIFAALAALIFVSALMVQYPTAAQTFFTLLGLCAVASLATMVVATYRYCKENNIQSQELADMATQLLPDQFPQIPEQLNSFNPFAETTVSREATS